MSERKAIMHTQTINFPDQQALCVFPGEHSNLAQAISELQLKGRYPVIVLVGSGIDEHQAICDFDVASHFQSHLTGKSSNII